MTPPNTVRLLDVEPDLGTGLDVEAWRRAASEGVFPSVRLPAGTLTEEPMLDGPLLLVEGFMTRELHLAGRWAGQVLGPGDVLDFGNDGTDLPCGSRWTALTPASGVALGDDFQRWSADRAPIRIAVMRRVNDQAARTLLVAAVSGLPRVEQRIVALLWILAGRWGTMTTAGAAVPISLTHATLGRLIGARRPTVTLALGRLDQDGIVRRHVDGRFLLMPGSDAGLAGLRGIVGPGRTRPNVGQQLASEVGRLQSNSTVD